jgi:hypothetical protein
VSGQNSNQIFPAPLTTHPTSVAYLNIPNNYTLPYENTQICLVSDIICHRRLFLLTYDGEGGRPRIDLTQYQLELCGLFHEGLTFDQLSTYLLETYQLNINTRTLKRRFQAWEVRRRIPAQVEDAAKRRIQILFFEVGLEDSDILTILHKEGFQIGRYTLVRLRFELGLRRRVRGVEQCQEADQLVRRLVAEELEKGVIDGYGRRYLYTHFRQRGHIVARDRLFEAYRTMNFEAVERRKRDLQRHRGEYIVPGPNFVWSIDGYCKLRPYGVEIYACIDAYSRYIVWVYVGISASTAVSCAHQFFEALEEVELQPRFVRSDRGVETVMLADAHYQLQTSYEPDLEFQECYLYGTSTANQRIEAWWQQLSKGLIFRWRVGLLLVEYYILITKF